MHDKVIQEFFNRRSMGITKEVDTLQREDGIDAGRYVTRI
jgi:hypothetical protein